MPRPAGNQDAALRRQLRAALAAGDRTEAARIRQQLDQSHARETVLRRPDETRG